MYYEKMILAVALLLTGIVSAQADGREKPITIDNLPKAAQDFSLRISRI